jgi:hypothetical protein
MGTDAEDTHQAREVVMLTILRRWLYVVGNCCRERGAVSSD